MRYTIDDFIRNLSRETHWREVDLQDDEALELLNEYLPRNLMVKRIIPERENIFNGFKMRAKLQEERG